VFGRAQVYQLIPEDATQDEIKTVLPPLRGRPLFSLGVHYNYLIQRFNDGATIETTTNVSEILTNYANRRPDDKSPIPLFVITEDGSLVVVTADQSRTIRSGKLVISLTNGASSASDQVADWHEVEKQNVETV
jgi:hypothetical protein